MLGSYENQIQDFYDEDMREHALQNTRGPLELIKELAKQIQKHKTLV